ncbi:MAG TPA: hypothetical protein VME45_09730, partial [Stellaceae bacterium]|nr:hypothetical protein [Stellaceae bacterium]
MRTPLNRSQPPLRPDSAGQPPAAAPPPLLTRLYRDALRGFAASPLYRHTLMGRVPADLRLRVGER